MTLLKKFMTSAFIALTVSVGATGSALADDDVKGSSDIPLIGRFAGSWIDTFKQQAFDETRLLTAPFINSKDTTAWKNFEGKVTNLIYSVPHNSHSVLEVYAALKENMVAKNVEILFECKDTDCFPNNPDAPVRDFLDGALGGYGMIFANKLRFVYGRGKIGSNDLYFNLQIYGNGEETDWRIRSVEVKPMQTGQGVFVDSSAIEKSLNATGKVTLYGIQFDFNKADIKPESKPTLDEIAKYMKGHADQKIAVVGYTDNKGGFAFNMDLSKHRADAVAAALASTYGIASNRLDPSGAGMGSPVASNDTEDGQAKNRRVELVKE